MKDPRDVIIEPIVSEKSYGLLEANVYTFRVHPSSSKPEIRDAVQTLFGVRVLGVNTLNRKGKRTKHAGCDWKHIRSHCENLYLFSLCTMTSTRSRLQPASLQVLPSLTSAPKIRRS